METVIKKALRKFSEYLFDLRAGKNFESLKKRINRETFSGNIYYMYN